MLTSDVSFVRRVPGNYAKLLKLRIVSSKLIILDGDSDLCLFGALIEVELFKEGLMTEDQTD